jgi:hypothetical protein
MRRSPKPAQHEGNNQPFCTRAANPQQPPTTTFAPSSRSFAPPSLAHLRSFPPSRFPPYLDPRCHFFLFSLSSALLPYLHPGPSSSAIDVSHQRWNKKSYSCLPLKEDKRKTTDSSLHRIIRPSARKGFHPGKSLASRATGTSIQRLASYFHCLG